MLPYTPLHHLLLAAVGGPLVMTSGNLSDEPIAFRNDDALARLGGIADLFLMHDREIETRCDDSVAAVIAGRGVVLRRSRGYVPRAVRAPAPRGAAGARVRRAAEEHVLPRRRRQRVARPAHRRPREPRDLRRVPRAASPGSSASCRSRPEVVAHDLHPDYLSTRLRASSARRRFTSPVQHHHAHVASAMAEHGLDGPVIGVAYDGTGYGTDGTSWGGEMLVADARRRSSAWRRSGRCRWPAATARSASRGGSALALVVDAFGGDLPPAVGRCFAGVAGRETSSWCATLLRRRLPLPRAHGVGRYFDAFGALFLGRRTASFEGQVALEWNQAADPAVDRRLSVRPSSTRRAVAARPAAGGAGRGRRPVRGASRSPRLRRGSTTRSPRRRRRSCAASARASGRCRSCDRRLLPERAARRGRPRGARAGARRAPARAVPPGDGGIALGQAVVADAITRES